MFKPKGDLGDSCSTCHPPALLYKEDTRDWTTVLSVVTGMLTVLVVLFALLLFLQYRRLRKGYTPLTETQLSNKRYTEEA